MSGSPQLPVGRLVCLTSTVSDPSILHFRQLAADGLFRVKVAADASADAAIPGTSLYAGLGRVMRGDYIQNAYIIIMKMTPCEDGAP